MDLRGNLQSGLRTADFPNTWRVFCACLYPHEECIWEIYPSRCAMCMFVKLVFLNFRLIEDKFIQVHADESVQEKIASAPQLTKIGVSYGSNMLKFHTNSRSTLPPTNYRSRKHVNHFPQKLRFHDLALIFFLKQTKNTWKTNAQIRFVLDLAMLNTFQFGPGVPSQVVERPPRRPLGCVTNLQICWML